MFACISFSILFFYVTVTWQWNCKSLKAWFFHVWKSIIPWVTPIVFFKQVAHDLDSHLIFDYWSFRNTTRLKACLVWKRYIWICAFIKYIPIYYFPSIKLVFSPTVSDRPNDNHYNNPLTFMHKLIESINVKPDINGSVVFCAAFNHGQDYNFTTCLAFTTWLVRWPKYFELITM